MITVYTAVFGGFDDLRPVEVAGRYVAFVDDDNTAPGWEIHRLPPQENPRLMARRIKILSHEVFPDSEYTIWIDGRVQLAVPPEAIVGEWLAQSDLAAFYHPRRHCIYDEAKELIYWRHEDRDAIFAQAKEYALAGFPRNQGLAETRVVVRHHTPLVRQFNRCWWQQVQKHTVRDQVSFPYAAWKVGLRWAGAPMMVAWAHPWFNMGSHKGERAFTTELPIDIETVYGTIRGRDGR